MDHDDGYASGEETKKVCDEKFRNGIKVLTGSKGLADLAKFFVVTIGSINWAIARHKQKRRKKDEWA